MSGWVRNLSVGRKVGATLGIISVLFLVAIGVGWLGIGSIVSTTDRDSGVAGAAHATAAAAYNMRISQAQNVLVRGHVKNPDGSDMHKGDVAAFRAALAKLRAEVPKGALRAVDADYAAWTATDGRIGTLTAAGRTRAATALLNTAANTQGDAVAMALGTLGDRWTAAAERRSASARSTAETEMLIAALVALLGAAAGTFLLSRRLRRASLLVLDRLRALQEHDASDLRSGLEALAAGDLTHAATPVTEPIEDLGGDELGRIATAVNGIRSSTVASVTAYDEARIALSGMIGEVGRSADTLSAASQQMASTSAEAGRAVGEIANAVGDVAQGAERQVRSVESARSVVEEVAGQTARSAAGAQETAEVVEQTREVAQAGAQAVSEATDAMVAVREAATQATQAIRDLGAKSDQIGGIVDTITGIAEQTNLLALNAAIEAARAGEHGRGFAVVAEEVRKLAEESQDAASSISSLVAEIQTETGRAVEVVESGGARTEQGAATVEEARQSFLRIASAVDDVTARVTDIAAGAQQIAASTTRVQGDIAEVAAVAEQTSASSEEVSASTEQTSASTQEIAASAQELARTAEQLSALVARFAVAEV